MDTEIKKELEQKIRDLEKRVSLLEKYVDMKKIQQITLPLDEASKKIINNI